jgi:Cysteine rich repeat
MLHTLGLFAVLLVGTGTAWAQSGMPHTPAEERACRGDAHRFCKDVLSDEFQVASCLQERRNHVSPACRTVLQGPRTIARRPPLFGCLEERRRSSGLELFEQRCLISVSSGEVALFDMAEAANLFRN